MRRREFIALIAGAPIRPAWNHDIVRRVFDFGKS
jgi:hypothetical protein